MLMQHTSLLIGDNIVNDDLSVTTDGVPNPNAIVTVVDGVVRLDITGNGIIDANDIPTLGAIRVTREPGWQGNLGYRVVLEDWAEGSTPNAIALAIYNAPNGEGYQYTTGGMIWDGVKEEWFATCPPGFEPGQNNIYMGFLFGAKKISSFIMHSQWDEQTFSGGGDWA